MVVGAEPSAHHGHGASAAGQSHCSLVHVLLPCASFVPVLLSCMYCQERRYLLLEFPDLARPGPLHVVELGCG
jgi:hypothetical protein